MSKDKLNKIIEDQESALKALKEYAGTENTVTESYDSIKEKVNSVEMLEMEKVLKKNNYNKSKAAKELGISRSTFNTKLNGK